jgi:rhomboid family GlyGly-CTERM serine protease
VVVSPVLARTPWWTLGLLAAALTALWWPGAANVLVYDRSCIAGGELWRIVTGNLVHFSARHLASNFAVLLPAAWLVETRYRGDARLLILTASPSIGIALLVGEPGILQFGGASGISIAFLVYGCLRGLHEEPRWRTVCMILLAVMDAKFTAESFGWHLRDWQTNEGFVPIMLSHAVGAAAGGVVYLRRIHGCSDPFRQPVTGPRRLPSLR